MLIEFFILVASAKVVFNKTNISISWSKHLKSLLSAVIMGAILYLTKLNLFGSIIIGAVVYILSLYLTGVLNKEFIFELINLRSRKNISA